MVTSGRIGPVPVDSQISLGIITRRSVSVLTALRKKLYKRLFSTVQKANVGTYTHARMHTHTCAQTHASKVGSYLLPVHMISDWCMGTLQLQDTYIFNTSIYLCMYLLKSIKLFL